MREKLIELVGQVQDCGCDVTDVVKMNYVENNVLVDHLLANGVTIVPWKIGDEFWTEWVGIRKVRCSMLTQKADGTWKGRFTVENSGGAGINVAFDKSERRLFRTKEEAEAAFLPKGE